MSPDKFTKTIGTLFKKAGYSKGTDKVAIGIEFENETKSPFELPIVEGFGRHQDNSLRLYGFEYVSNPPAENVDVLKTLCQNYFKALNAAKGPRRALTNSIRTSTHLHFDVTQYTYPQLYVFLCVYWTLEEFLSFFCGAHRQGNLFALRLKDTTYMKSDLAEAITAREPSKANVFQSQFRYASANLNAVPKFGSLEFRLMRGVSEYEDAKIWIEALEAIRVFSLRFQHPKELEKFYMDETSAVDFPRIVLGDNLFKEIVKYTPWKEADLKYSIQSSFMNILPIIAAGKNWDFTEEIKEAERRRQEVLQELERQHRQIEAGEFVEIRPEPQEIDHEAQLLAELQPRANLAAPARWIMAGADGDAGWHPPRAVGQPVVFLRAQALIPENDQQDQIELQDLIQLRPWMDE